MKDSITLHPEHGLNPSIEVCMICGEDKYGHRTRGNKNVLWVVWLS